MNASGLVSFELTESAADRLGLQEPAPAGSRLLSPEKMLSLAQDQTLEQAFESLQVIEIRPYFARPQRRPSSREESRLARIYQAVYASGLPAREAAVGLAACPSVVNASPVPLRLVAGLPSDEKFYMQWGFRQSSDFDMDLPEAWDVSVGDSTIVLAVVDTGMDRVNPDLGGPSARDAGNVWINRAEVDGVPGEDDDSNGYVDDVWGWDWVHYTETGETPWLGEDYLEEDNDPSDYHGHGTAVAGVAGALGDNVEGIAGFLWRCKVMGLRAGLAVRVGSQRVGVVRMDWCAKAIAYAVDMGAAAINASWESGFDVGLEAAVDYAVSEGIVLAVAAGNRGTSDPGTVRKYNYLSTRGDCVDVGAVQSGGVRWSESNYGPWVDVSAPGVSVLTLGFRPPDTREYWYHQGTSFAAPAVTALAALVRSIHPDWSADRIRQHLMSTSTPLDPPDSGAGAGLVNAFRAVRPDDGGWSVSPDGSVETPAMPVKERGRVAALAAGLSGGRAGAWSVSGEPLDGWPIPVGQDEWAGVASGDVDGDGEHEVVLADESGLVAVLRLRGGLMSSWTAGSTPAGEPVLADLTGDGAEEILLATEIGSVFAWTGAGGPVPGWPVVLDALPAGAPAAADLDGDGRIEVVITCGDGTVYCLSSAGSVKPGWPVTAPAGFQAPPSLGDMGGDDETPEVFAIANDGRIHVWDSDGAALAEGLVELCDGVGGRGVYLGDLDSDDVTEIAVPCSDRRIAVYDARGFVEDGWPVVAVGAVRGLLFADADGDSVPEVVATVAGVGLCAWRLDGSELPNWPKPTDGNASAAASMGDFDNDGRPEFLAPTDKGTLNCWDLGGLSYRHTAALWPLPARTSGNTRLAALSAGIDTPPGDQGSGEVSPFRIAYVGASPNPFRGITEILSRVEGPDDVSVRMSLEIFDVAGRLVRKFDPVSRGLGMHKQSWDGKDEGGRPVPSGVYMCLVRAGESAKACNVVVLR
jgi:subtilisin family serine protease